MANIAIGIMQGRLSQKLNLPLQSFPYESWENEFSRAKKIGFKNIEWLIDKETDYHNPLFSEKGREKIAYLSEKNQISIETLCLHFLINGSVLKSHRKSNSLKNYLLEICKLAPEMGIKYLSIPLLDKMSLIRNNVKAQIEPIINLILSETSIEILLETDISTIEEISFIRKFNTKRVGILYDTGNAIKKDSLFTEDFPSLFEFVREIHIKDFSKRKNQSVRLGEGDVNFTDIFSTIKILNWEGLIILETPIFDNWDEEALINYKYIYSFLQEYS